MEKMIRRMVFGFVCLSILSCPFSSVWADRVDDLEKKIQVLEQQLQDLKGVLQAEKETAPAAPAAAPTTQLVGPGGTLNVGGDIRWRGRYFDNVWDFSDASGGDQSESFRFRPRLWLDWKPTEDSEAYLRIMKEFLWGGDQFAPGYNMQDKDVMFDNAWFSYKDIFGAPVDIKIGRQDIIYGDGFVILEGTPQDGSQTIAFDALKATLKHDLGTTDFLYSKLQEFSHIPADDEDLFGIYNQWKIADFGIEPYFLYKDQRAGIRAYTTPTTNYSLLPAQQTFLLGFRGTKKVDFGNGIDLALAAEIGKEWGTIDFSNEGTNAANLRFAHGGGATEQDRDAWGGQVNGVLTFNDVAWKPSLKAAFSYMSGDDPTTPDYEGWDDMYAQWPKYSELYIYTIADAFKFAAGNNDPDPGAWNNMLLPEFSVTFKPMDKMSQMFRYIYFLADEENGPGLGDERGHNLQWLTTYDFNKNLSGHLLAEWFDPGDYYPASADEALFMRFQLNYKF